MGSDRLHLEFDLACPAQYVRTWWTDLPDRYEATDPREQPHVIEVLERHEDRQELATTWRGPLGTEFTMRETLRFQGEHAWTYDVPGKGFHTRDEFEVVDTEEGCRLSIDSTMSYDHLGGRILRALMIPRWKQKFTENWNQVVDVLMEEYDATPSVDEPPSVP